MKNLFLTLALMCCVSFAFANEKDDSKKDAEKPKAEDKTVNLDMWCFALSCDVVCGNQAVPDEHLEWVWYMLESGICH